MDKKNHSHQPPPEGAAGQEAIGDTIAANVTESKNVAIGKNINQTIYEGYTAEEVAILIAEARRADAVATVAVEIPAPPEPAKPPEILGFVGRDQELTYFAQMLEESHLAVIAGMAGVGKTALAATLVAEVGREQSRVFWYSFHEGEGIDGIVWSLAGFLAWHGKDELWKLLQSARLTGGQPPPTETLFDYLLQLLRNGNYLLCFDDFHHVDDDPTLNQLVERLRQALVAGQLSIIITSRRVPEFVTIAQVEPVDGLSERDTQRLLHSKGVQLTPEQMEQLYSLTAGNAEFLILAIDALQNARHPQALIEQLAATDDVERYLLREVDDVLTGAERAVMNALAALLGYAATRDAIEAVVDRGNVLRTLRGLSERHLLIVQETDAGRAYRQHDLVRDFYYEMSSRRERKQLHTRAGEYYRDEEADLLLAGIHYERAGEVEEAAQLATQDVWGIINRGQARILTRLLVTLASQQLSPKLAIMSHLAVGQLYSISGEREDARNSYDAATQLLNKYNDFAALQHLQIELCRGMAQLLEFEAPEAAIDWLQQGLAISGGSEANEAALHIQLGTVLFTLGRYDEAMNASTKGLELLPDTPSQLRSIALRDLGSIHNVQGQTALGIQYTEKALEVSEFLNDRFSMVAILANMGSDHMYVGDKDEAISYFQRALELSASIGDRKHAATIHLNMAMAHSDSGNFTTAYSHLETCIEIAREVGDKLTYVFALNRFAELYMWENRWNEAYESLTQAEDVAVQIGDQSNLPFIHGLRSRVLLERGMSDAALQEAVKGIKLAYELEDSYAQGVCLRFYGIALRHHNEFDLAMNALKESLEVLADLDPYEIASSKLEVAHLLFLQGDKEKALEILSEAQGKFQELNAHHQLQRVEELLAKCHFP